MECGKDRMLKKLSALIAVLGSFALASCYPSSENKEEVKMDNQIPITGFERNIKIDLDGTLLSVPYGYLAGSSRDSATRWMSDEEKIYKGGRLDIYVHAKRKGDSWILEPFNRENKDKFVKALKDGSFDITEITLQKGCNLKLDSFIKLLDHMKIDKQKSYFKDYVMYENMIEFPFHHEINYLREDNNPVSITVREYRKKGGLQYFSSSVNACMNGISISYYPYLYEDNLIQPTQKDLVDYHQKVEELISSFIK